MTTERERILDEAMKMSSEDRRWLMSAIHERSLASAVENIRPGDSVSFTSSKTGRVVKGVAQRVNRKSVRVLASDGTIWMVSPNLLTVETKR